MNLKLICYIILPFFASGLYLQAQEPIPVLTFDELEEKLPENSEQLVIVNFWATWCKPCVKEMPYFNELSKTYEGDRGVKVILVSLDMETQMQSRVIPFIEDRRLHPEVWLLDDPDANRWIDRVDPSWSGAIPATLFYKGHQRKFYQQSFHSVAELEDIIQSFK